MRHSGILRAEQLFKTSTWLSKLIVDTMFISLLIYFEEHLLSFFRTRVSEVSTWGNPD